MSHVRWQKGQPIERFRGSVTLDATWEVRYDPDLAAEASALAGALQRLLGERIEVSEGPGTGPTTIELATEALPVRGLAGGQRDEAYRLTVSAEDGIRIIGSDRAGVFYGVQSLLGLMPPDAHREPATSLGVPAVVVEDAPRFRYRGLHLDVARNFHPVGTVEKLLELMARYKLNRFHVHLTDDEGWRLAIAALPELSEMGGHRGHTLDETDHLVPSFGSGPDPDPSVSNGSGFYSRDEFVHILRFAHDRHILVIPEIDTPGHARAAVKAMGVRYARLAAEGREEDARAFLLTDLDDRSVHRSVQGWNDHVMNPCQESTYHFVATVIDEIGDMYREAGAELTAIHIGGDEVPRGVWEGSPVCESFLAGSDDLGGVDDLFPYFVDRVSAIVHDYGLRTAGWEEIALSERGQGGPRGRVPNAALLDRDLQPYVWNNVWRGGAEDLGYRIANAGFPVVLANATGLYFDLAYDRDPREPGFMWAGLTDARTVYEFVPLDLFKSAREDLSGRPIDPDTEFADRVRLTETGRENVLGIQGQLWGENAKGPEMLEYLAFPKLLALAERAWAPQPAWTSIPGRAQRDPALDSAWNEFANRMGQRELVRLDGLLGGVSYRIPPPGAVVEEGALRANVAFPGLQIRYTTDGREPVADSSPYEGPVAVSGEVRVRVFDTRGRGSREARPAPIP